jgi:hypothetical protein
MSWTPPSAWVESASQLKKSASVMLDANGNGVITFDPDSAHQRWVVEQVVVTTNQPASAVVVPVASLAINTVDLTTMSSGNQRGATWNGIQDTFTGNMDVGPCDFLTVLFNAPTGDDGTQIAGVQANVIVTGTKYTRRA